MNFEPSFLYVTFCLFLCNFIVQLGKQELTLKLVLTPTHHHKFLTRPRHSQRLKLSVQP